MMKDKQGARRRRIRLAPYRQLHKGAARRGHVLICPTGPVQLNDSAAKILALCDGTRTREEIVERAVQARDRSLAGDVRDFLDAARRRGWIVES
jgi:pyrroloquinoline quinone biosynthesis protein D